jgi:transcriptional regulator with XRE-family HTH domain
MSVFGDFIRRRREEKRDADASYSVRQLAGRIGVEPSYLSKIERGEQAPPSEEKIVALADELDQDADAMLAMAGKISSDLQQIIRQRPALFAELIREMKDMPEHAMLRIVREVRDGEW